MHRSRNAYVIVENPIALSRSHTIHTLYLQLELKTPKSRIYLNETQVGPLEEMPFPGYNPRVLAEGMEGENLKTYDIIEGCTPKDLWTWNIGGQQYEMDRDQEFLDASLPKYSMYLYIDNIVTYIAT